MGHQTGRLLVKFSEWLIVIVGTADTKFTLCSVRPHNFSNLNLPPGCCPDLRTFCLHLLSYPDILTHFWTICYYFPPNACAFVASRSNAANEVVYFLAKY